MYTPLTLAETFISRGSQYGNFQKCRLSAKQSKWLVDLLRRENISMMSGSYQFFPFELTMLPNGSAILEKYFPEGCK